MELAGLFFFLLFLVVSVFIFGVFAVLLYLAFKTFHSGVQGFNDEEYSRYLADSKSFEKGLEDMIDKYAGKNGFSHFDLAGDPIEELRIYPLYRRFVFSALKQCHAIYHKGNKTPVAYAAIQTFSTKLFQTQGGLAVIRDGRGKSIRIEYSPSQAKVYYQGELAGYFDVFNKEKNIFDRSGVEIGRYEHSSFQSWITNASWKVFFQNRLVVKGKDGLSCVLPMENSLKLLESLPENQKILAIAVSIHAKSYICAGMNEY